MNPRVSVIMPVYNGDKYIEIAINSVQSQSFEDWELIIVDDGSIDNSLKIATQYSIVDKRIKTYTHILSKNRGVSASRNLGISHSRGEYIALLDADDVWDKEKLDKQLEVFNNNADVAVVYSQLTTLFNEKYNDFPEMCGTGNMGVNTNAFEKMVWDQLWMPNSSVIFRRIVLSKVSGFNENLFYQVEDHLFFTKVVYFYKCYFLKESTGFYRIHNSSYSFNTKWKNSMYEFLLHLLLDISIKPKKVICKAFFKRVIFDIKYLAK
jgi:glycosyltransferase involved in cell wall biosynthesis